MARSTSEIQWLESIESLPLIEILPGMRGRFVHSEHMTFAFWEIDEGFILPAHSHPHEQVTHMIEGQFELSVDGEIQTLSGGAVATIPSEALHSGKALKFCRIMDIFYPKRTDYQFN
ncbi:MAG: cupin domain-containing protein [Alphaproteobacteria bacterium]|nr:cupin domain-containing protein [Alphaproteobacteria bacterium]